MVGRKNSQGRAFWNLRFSAVLIKEKNIIVVSKPSFFEVQNGSIFRGVDALLLLLFFLNSTSFFSCEVYSDQ